MLLQQKVEPRLEEDAARTPGGERVDVADLECQRVVVPDDKIELELGADRRADVPSGIVEKLLEASHEEVGVFCL